MTPAQAAEKFAEMARRLPEAISDAERHNLGLLLEAAQRRSQGPLQPQDLKRLNHPYARRRVRLNPDVINKVSGDFERGWEIENPALQGGELVSELHNTDPKAASLEQGLVFGRPLMIEREPHLAAYEDIRETRERNLAAVWDVVLR